MIPRHGIKIKDITAEALPESKIEDTLGYQVDGTDEVTQAEIISNYGDRQAYFWEGADDRGFGTWVEVTFAAKKINVENPEESEIVPLDAQGEQNSAYKTKNSSDVHTLTSSELGEVGLVISSMDHSKHDIAFVPLGGSGTQRFKDVGDSVELLNNDGTGSGKFYYKEAADPVSAFHTGVPPYVLGRSYLGVVKREPNGNDFGIAILDIQGHGLSNNVPL